jgi:outer membrane protein TolC
LAELSLPSLSLDLQSLQQQAVERRSDVAALTERIRAYQEKAKAIRAEGKPQVELGVQYAYQENRFRDPQALSSATLGVEWTPLDGGRRRHEAAAWLAKSTSLARLRDDTIQRIHAQVRNAALGVQEATRRVELLRCTLVHAEENLRLAEQRYAAGAGTNTEVLDAVAHRSHTIRGFHSARYDAALSSYRLGHALGKL